ncbi:hypothetical protein GCM10010168_39800 [Actinoplanes ianthinogenes]|uniref:Uncharacterized protein n=1 Tax=Actinoplanes ianthinogenes TaxID=122358 RepID=A0ABN6CDS5_9ACTN|nr:hypothetical protein [Actinoplanes ianthinogenes]BCJ43711.1 hypothetical protein Aiant_43680 [Actinoplanes ianthinogenes]GGR18149.1 hypothetical protein GCM10010168_39800 [Actinoplanes ianthinogenes]
MPHLPDDDGYAPPLKVLRKRLNGVYREDYGLSGPTRRYILMVALLVGLASIPTLAVITAGTSEIAGNKRNGAMDAPFLPPPATGPVRPSPTPKNHLGYDDPRRSPTLSGTPSPTHPGVSPSDRTGDSLPAVPGLPPVPADPPPSPSDVDAPADPDRDAVSRPAAPFPTVPGLPEVPDEDWDAPLARRAPAAPADDLWNAPEFPRIPDTPEPAGSAEPGHPSDEAEPTDAEDDEPSGSDRSSSDNPDSSDDADSSDGSWDADPPGDEPDQNSSYHDSSSHDSSHHECEAVLRSTVIDRRRSRSRSSRRSAVTERPHVNAARVVAYNYGDSRNVRRSMTQPRSDENRITNRPYRGHHRAEHTRHDENTPARQRSSRVGRHHADSAGEHRLNHR